MSRSLTATLKAWNRYRDALNPRRGLTLARAARLLESYVRGDYADVMWTLGAPALGIESADADLLTIVTRRRAALVEMEWDIRTVSESDSRYDEALASEQRAALRRSYERIDGLYAAIAHLATAAWRGFAHVEIDARTPDIRLTPVNQWNIVRDGTTGRWRYNPQALSTSFEGLPDTHTLDATSWLIREVDTPLCAIALVKFVRENLVEKDWDAFIEIFGLPNGVVTAPPDSPETEKFAEVAKALHEGADAALPAGSTWTPNPAPRDTSIFGARLDHLQRKLILAGTGGLLTSLAMPQGIGSGAAQQQADVFARLATGDARAISELFQRQIDRVLLSQQFPGQPRLAYFALTPVEGDDSAAYIDGVAKLAAAGYAVDAAEISEHLGWKVTPAPAPAPAPFLQRRSNGNQNRKKQPKETP
ncbi:MAG: DUF935 domain-containing protein [Opitutaceae bacterium]|jgi:phage gp29-like protein|nr:DUF935 domain-containing protein [Opitutaceae bacterium]